MLSSICSKRFECRICSYVHTQVCFCCCPSQVLTIKLKVQLVAFSCILFIYSFYFACFNLIVLCLSCCGLFRPGARLTIERLALAACLFIYNIFEFLSFDNPFDFAFIPLSFGSNCCTAQLAVHVRWEFIIYLGIPSFFVFSTLPCHIFICRFVGICKLICVLPLIFLVFCSLFPARANFVGSAL